MSIGSAMALLIAMMQAATVGGAQTPSDIANATKFDLTVSDGHVIGCTVTATSGYAQVDLYVCSAARACGNQYATAAQRDACIADKREELARLLTRKPERGE